MRVQINGNPCNLVQVSRVNAIGSIFTLKGYGGSITELNPWAKENNFKILKQHGPNKQFQVVLKRTG